MSLIRRSLLPDATTHAPTLYDILPVANRRSSTKTRKISALSLFIEKRRCKLLDARPLLMKKPLLVIMKLSCIFRDLCYSPPPSLNSEPGAIFQGSSCRTLTTVAATEAVVYVACSTLCFARLPLERALRLIGELEFSKLDVAIHEKGPHLKPSEVAADIAARLAAHSHRSPLDPGCVQRRNRRSRHPGISPPTAGHMQVGQDVGGFHRHDPGTAQWQQCRGGIPEADRPGRHWCSKKGWC